VLPGMNAATAVKQKVLDLEHYLDVLRKKPVHWQARTPLAQWRQAGRWPVSFDRLWEALNLRHGRSEGTRQMIDYSILGAGHGWAGFACRRRAVAVDGLS